MPHKATPPLKGYRRYAWLVALVATAGVYVSVRQGAPLVLDGGYTGPLGLKVTSLAWIFALPFALLTLAALRRLIADRRWFKRQVREASLDNLSWRQFERLVGEMYGRQGYSMVEIPRRVDRGIDYMLARGPERWLVQCKHWQSRKVGVKTVRELASIVAARRAAGGIVITTGRFTPPAQAFATTSNIRLVDGKVLAEELLALSSKPGLEHLHPTHRQPGDGGGTPACPECGGDMIKRSAQHGDSAGDTFWSCARNPDCPGMVAID